MLDLVVPEGFSLSRSGSVSWIEAAMTGGVVRFTFARDREGRDFDLGLSPQGDLESLDRVTANRMNLLQAMGLVPEFVRVVDQVHGGDIRLVSPAEEDGCFLPASRPQHEADGMVARDDRTVLGVAVADCAAIAISGGRGRALLHCGWRGLATDMIERAVELVEGSEAVIGPCIGPCCFEVGSEVASRLGVERSARGTIDIAAIATGRLAALGVGETRTVDLCTRCNEDSFFSFRRQGKSAGRQMALFSPG